MLASFFRKRSLKRLFEQYNNNKDIINYAQDVLLFCKVATFSPQGIRVLRATRVETRYATITELTDKVDVYIDLMRCGGETISEMFNKLPDKKEIPLSRWFTEDGYSIDEMHVTSLLISSLKSLVDEVSVFKTKDDTLYTFYKTGAKSLMKELIQAILKLLSLNIE